MTTDAFAADLRSRGIQLVLRRRRLAVWPAQAYREGLTSVDRAYIREHRQELKELVRSGLPEPTVVWNADVAPDSTGTTAPPPEGPPPCPYCHRLCVGAQHHAFPVLHWHDPAEGERRRRLAQKRDTATRQGWRLAGVAPPSYMP